MEVIICSISFLASTIGTICGIGGGVIIKPVLDALGIFNVSTISFLSSCTVMAMSGYSAVQNLVSGKGHIDLRRRTPLGMGASIGGITGKYLFEFVKSLFPSANTVGAVQSIFLFVLTGATLLYMWKKEKIHTYKIQNRLVCIAVGIALGIISSFLGIGGGPINLVVFSYFFSMPTKIAAQNSLYIIFISQLGNLFMTLVTDSVPEFSGPILAGMACLGVLGSVTGHIINRQIATRVVVRLFFGLLSLIMIICVYNIYQYF